MTSEAKTPQFKPLFARVVADALTRHLYAHDSSLHWVQVIGESRLEPAPKLGWPVQSNAMFNLMVQNGWSEGVLLYVYAQPDRYKPDCVTPLLQIKLLCERQQLGRELDLIMTFMDQIEHNLYQRELGILPQALSLHG